MVQPFILDLKGSVDKEQFVRCRTDLALLSNAHSAMVQKPINMTSSQSSSASASTNASLTPSHSPCYTPYDKESCASLSFWPQRPSVSDVEGWDTTHLHVLCQQ